MTDLSELLHDAVADVDPHDRLDEIRSRTSTPARSAARPWCYAAGGVVLATAATVAGFAVVDSSPPPHDHGSMVEPVPTGSQLVAAYFVGDSRGSDRLYREFDWVPAGDPAQAALDRIQQPSDDPDYRTPWPAGSFGTVTVSDDRIDVDLAGADRVHGLAAQQVVYTLQAAAGQRLPVYFWRDGQRGNAPVLAAPELDVLNQVSISDPAEGNEYAGSFIARGRALEGTVTWEIRLPDGPRGEPVVARGSTTVDAPGDRLYPWQVDIDLAGIQPGTYSFVAANGSFTDTRTITVR